MKKPEYKNFSDAKLCELLVSSDQLAFTELVDRYHGILYRHAYKLLRGSEEAKDVVQDLFTWLWDNHKELNFNSNFSGLLYTRIRNKIFDMIIHDKVKSKYLDTLPDFMETGTAETDHLVRTRNLKDIIEREISELPEKMRVIFEMSRHENLSYKEIAEKLDISENTVRKQVSNALGILRGKLGLFVYLIFVIFYK